MDLHLDAGTALLAAGTAGTGLVAGIFLAFATAVMPGLARGDDRTFVAALQQVNVAIVNPLFVTVLVAPVLLLGVAAFTGPARWWVLAALVLRVATLLVTGAGNIPLNDALAAAGATDPAAARQAFEDPWNRLHLVRTLTVTAAFGCCLVALVRGG